MLRLSLLRNAVQLETKKLLFPLYNNRLELRRKSGLSEAASLLPAKPTHLNAPLADAINSAASLVQPKKPVEDPFSIVSKEMSTLATNIGKLLGSNHSTLNKVAMYYFQSEGKHIRPLIVLVLSKALSEIPLSEKDRGSRDESDVKSSDFSLIDDALSPLDILHEVNPNVVLNPLSRPMDAFPSETDGILPKQRRLAEIVEMIHTASLLHDDIIDNSAAQRGSTSGNTAFGNKMAILAGDFLLGRASVAIARLRNAEAIELLSTTIANLVEGEFMQLMNTTSTTSDTNSARLEYYIHTAYLKTASLMSKSCRATAVLSGARENIVEACYQFGRNLGLCFQIVDDMVEYTTSENNAKKFGDTYSKCSLATAPVLFAREKYPELDDMIERQFSEPGDIELARSYVKRSGGLERTRELALKYATEAINQLMVLPESDARQALINVTNTMVIKKL